MQSPMTRFLNLSFLFFIILFLLRIPFFLSGDFSDEAFIGFQCSENLFHHGIIGFNLQEKTSTCSSYLYLIFLTVHRFLFGFISPVSIAISNTILLLSGIFLICASICKLKPTIAGKKKLNHTLSTFFVLSISPWALKFSYSGLNTSLFILMVGILIYSLVNLQSIMQIFVPITLFLLPILRLDGIIVSIFFLGCFYALENSKKKELFSYVTATFSGIIAYFVFNLVYFGSPLSQTSIVQIQNNASVSLQTKVWLNFIDLFWRVNELHILNPLSTPEANFLIPIFLFLFLLCTIYLLFRSTHYYSPIFFLLGIGFSIPLSNILKISPNPELYSIGGFLLYCVTVKGGFDLLENKKWLNTFKGKSLIFLFPLTLSVFQYFQAIKQGEYDFRFNEFVLNDLQELENEEIQILTDKPGFLTFHKNIYSHDIQGIAQPKVSIMKRREKENWLEMYLREKDIKFVIKTTRDSENKTFRQLDQRLEDNSDWFQNEYELIKEHDYMGYLNSKYEGIALKIRKPKYNTKISIYKRRTKG